jgi:hypothetical protein
MNLISSQLSVEDFATLVCVWGGVLHVDMLTLEQVRLPSPPLPPDQQVPA